MKTLSTISIGLCLAGAIVLTPGAAQADQLLVVDLTVSDQVTITATDGNSAVTTSGSDGTGVYFEGFYGVPGSSLNDVLVSGDLTNVGNPASNVPNLFRAGAGADPGLNLWNWSPDFSVSFTAGSQAFTGSGTWTVTSANYADMIAGGNRGGNLWFPADDVGDLAGAEMLGTYKVIVTQVPAPGALALLGLAGVASRRRRRQ